MPFVGFLDDAGIVTLCVKGYKADLESYKEFICYNIIMNELTPIQKEIVSALEQLKEKALITEAVLAKKVRENTKIQGKNKAGISLKDLEVCVEYLAQNNQLTFALHLNSANDILIKKEEAWKLLDGNAKKRRQSSEKSISVLTNGDLRQKASGGKVLKKRSDRKKVDFRRFEDFE